MDERDDTPSHPKFHKTVRLPIRLDPAFSPRFYHHSWKFADQYYGGPTRPLPEANPTFKERYDWGELPITVLDEGINGYAVRWLAPIQEIDYDYYLPIFFKGLSEVYHPYTLAANSGLHELLSKGGRKVILALPYCIQPLCEALQSNDTEILSRALIATQHLYEAVGPILQPYYNRIIPLLNQLKLKTEYIEARVHPKQLMRGPFGALVVETLTMLQQAF